MTDRLTEAEFWDLADGFMLDLRAVFSMIEDDAKAIVSKGIREGKTPEAIIQELEESL